MQIIRSFVTALALVSLAGTALGSGTTGAGLVVLNPTASGALSITGNSSIQVPAAAVYVNSNSSTAVRTVGAARLDCPDLYIVGTPSFGGNSGCSGTVHRALVPFANPLQTFSIPSREGVADRGGVNIRRNDTVTLQPGRYTGNVSVTGNARITLSPGVYFFEAGLSITAGTVSGQGVTIIMITGALNLAGTSSLLLSPPTQGMTANVVITSAPNNTSGMSLAGGSEVVVTGTIYSPAALLTLTGNSQIVGQGPLMGDLVVTDRIQLTGTGSVRIGQAAAAPIALPTQPLFD